jgi:hypothetical protein
VCVCVCVCVCNGNACGRARDAAASLRRDAKAEHATLSAEQTQKQRFSERLEAEAAEASVRAERWRDGQAVAMAEAAATISTARAGLSHAVGVLAEGRTELARMLRSLPQHGEGRGTDHPAKQPEPPLGDGDELADLERAHALALTEASLAASLAAEEAAEVLLTFIHLGTPSVTYD